ncbi:MAG: hypothetical protein IPO88_19200 [Nannocystis sp.]|uniref:hypothetical protein n=1 Tax=Nannocystis sp. TaxID=1962667 RepID=UPI0024248EB8|nr:hypothetical protein [Nannocystis sp.]MBK9755596.1 hypothetical protein [Nannocystis sp.]
MSHAPGQPVPRDMSHAPGADVTRLRAVHRLVRAVQRRERLAEATRLLTGVALPLGFLIAAIAIAGLRRFASPDAADSFLAYLPWLGLLPAPLLLLWAALRPRHARHAARRLDHHYALHDLLGGAVELTTTTTKPDADPRSQDLIALVSADAEAAAAGLDPRPVVPLPRPGARDLLLGWLGALAVLGAMFVPPAPAPVIAIVDGPGASLTAVPVALRPAPDRALAEPLREDLRTLVGGQDSAAKIAEAMLEVLDAFTRGEIDRAAAFARLEQLEQELAKAEAELEASEDADPAILAEGMRELAEALEQEAITTPAGEALARGEPDRAEQALAAAEDAAASNEADMQSLERAMAAAEKALGKAAGENTDTAAQLAEAERRLKRQQKQPAADPEEQERRLKKQQDRVDQLRRQHEKEKEAQRQLDQLRRDANDAKSGSKGKEQQKRALEKLRRDASNTARKAQRSRRLGQASDDMEEAKSFLRRAGNGDKQDQKRREQMQRFAKAAKGKRGDKQKGPTMLVEGDIGDSGEPIEMDSGDGEGDGDGDGQGDGDGDGDGQGDSAGQSQADGQGQGDGMGQGSQDPLADPTGIKAKTKAVRVNPRKGQGATRAEVIRTASQEGFANASYRDVFTDYKSFAQSSIDNESVPAPQRRRIKRYFQMIQPRR